jgi:hypothetical protein
MPRVTDALRGKTLVLLGAGLALIGTGTATAAAGFSASQAPAAHAKYNPAVHAKYNPAAHAKYNSVSQANVGTSARRHHVVARHHTGHQAARTRVRARRHAAHRGHHAHHKSWGAISRIVAERTIPRAGHGRLPALDRLTPVGTSGPQARMPITAARYHNAKTIVRQAIVKRMGLRAAVIAVATAMQESALLNLGYGDRDSLGLFQQRPSCGWGSPRQILHPKYAADAFLNALRGYQVRDPYWAHQPLWQAAQGVQKSGFPYAYAKWEAQAASLVASVTKHLV